MKPKTLRIDFSRQPSGYEIVIGHDLLAQTGNWAKKSLGKKAAKIAIVSNATVFKLYGKAVQESLENSGFEVFVWLMKDGERHKNLRSFEHALECFSENKLSRTDAVVALGGGVVGDLAGFASAVYLRGIAFLQIPTTVLAMFDSSVGGKTGVNSAFGKNLIGSFHQPRSVLVDTETLKTLPPRELTAGFCEAIKQGAISGKKLLMKTAGFLEKYPPDRFSSFFACAPFLIEIENLLEAQIAFKGKIVAQDEREDSARIDGRSRKILNFGHTLAHALEKVTDYKYLKHGEAVGYGILFATELSKMLALLDINDVKLLNDVVHRSGTLPPLNNLDPLEVFEAFRFDKKQVAGSLQMVLLKGIGKPVIVTEQDFPHYYLLKALKKLLQN